MSAIFQRFIRLAGMFAAYAVVAAVVAAPIAAERAVEAVRFDDRLGTLPVTVRLSHNGVSTLDTGVLGRLYWAQTGTGGFGASLRATGPPMASGTLASYASPSFVRANAQFVNDPEQLARAYGAELGSQLRDRFLWFELGAAVAGGLALVVVFRGRAPFPATMPRRRKVVLGVVTGTVCLGVSVVVAVVSFDVWEGSDAVVDAYAMPGVDELSFSDPQTLEIARQVQPFIEKNTKRIRERATRYEDAAAASLEIEIPAHAADLRPRAGETVVIAEADPQGSEVGTATRAHLYPLLQEYLGKGAFTMRTISGDVTSNGTVAEDGFVRSEAEASPGIAVVAVKGDHDTDTTVEQMLDHGMLNPDLETTGVGDLRAVAANDPGFKALFGGLVINETGVSATDVGQELREGVDPDEPLVVVLHQPATAAGYLGIDSLGDLDTSYGHETVPWDDGIPDLPPGTVNIGHYHDESPPRVIWNTDGDEVTWTVVNQLGTSGGVEESPTFNRFSTPFSVPLKTVSVQLQYVDVDSGLQTGYADIGIATDGAVTVADRVDVGLPLGESSNQ